MALSKISELFPSQHLILCLTWVFRFLNSEMVVCFQLPHLPLCSSIPSSGHIHLPDVFKAPHPHTRCCSPACPPRPCNSVHSVTILLAIAVPCVKFCRVLTLLIPTLCAQPPWPPLCFANLLSFSHHRPVVYAVTVLSAKNKFLPFLP